MNSKWQAIFIFLVPFKEAFRSFYAHIMRKLYIKEA